MRPNQFSTWLIGGMCAFAVASCTSQKDAAAPNLVRVSYAQTQCADRWGQARGTQQLATAAQAYLAQQGLALHQAQASIRNSGAICNACTCPTGLVLEGTVSPADLPAVLALGFTKQ